MTDGIRADLSRQIDLQGGVDDNDTLILSNQRRVVGVIAGMKLHERVVVDEIEDPFGPGHETGENSPGTLLFVTVGNRASLHPIDQPIRDHFRVNPEIPFVMQPRQDRVGDSSNPNLKRGAILSVTLKARELRSTSSLTFETVSGSLN